MKDYRYLYANMPKKAAAVLTPEAEQAAMQPPMDPAMAGGMPAGAPPAGMPAGAPPMDPAMAGGIPPAGAPPMDPSMTGGMPPQGGQIPPEILQDQVFMDFLQQTMGIMLDPNTGMFMDPQSGQPIPPEMIVQAYQVFQQEQAAAAQGGAPGGMPAGPEGAMPPPGGAAAAGVPEEVITQIASAVMSGVEAVLQEYTAALEKKIGALLDKFETVKGSVDSLQSTTDKRNQDDIDEDQKLRDELAADLQPTVKVAAENTTPQPIVMPKAAARKPVSLFNVIVEGNK